LGVGQGANNSPQKLVVTKRNHLPQAWNGPLVQTKQWKMDMRFGTWEYNIKLDLQEVGWEGMERIDLAQGKET